MNDLSMSGAKPLYLSLAFIIEEGLPLADLEKVVASMRQTAEEAGVQDRHRRYQGGQRGQRGQALHQYRRHRQ